MTEQNEIQKVTVTNLSEVAGGIWGLSISVVLGALAIGAIYDLAFAPAYREALMRELVQTQGYHIDQIGSASNLFDVTILQSGMEATPEKASMSWPFKSTPDSNQAQTTANMALADIVKQCGLVDSISQSGAKLRVITRNGCESTFRQFDKASGQ